MTNNLQMGYEEFVEVKEPTSEKRFSWLFDSFSPSEKECLRQHNAYLYRFNWSGIMESGLNGALNIKPPFND